MYLAVSLYMYFETQVAGANRSLCCVEMSSRLRSLAALLILLAYLPKRTSVGGSVLQVAKVPTYRPAL